MCKIIYCIYSNRMQAKENNFKSGLRTIRDKTIPGSEFPSVNQMLHCNRTNRELSAMTNSACSTIDGIVPVPLAPIITKVA